MAVLLDEAGGSLLDEAGVTLYDEAGAPGGGSVYALQQFIYHDTVSGEDALVTLGASRNPATSQAYAQTPASYWSATPLAGGTQISPRLRAYLDAYPTGGPA